MAPPTPMAVGREHTVQPPSEWDRHTPSDGRITVLLYARLP